MEELICLAEMGKSSIGLFHDVLNPISSLLLYLDFISQKKGIDENFRRDIRPLVRSSKKITDFIKIIQKDLSGTEGKKEIVKIDEIILSSIKILAYKSRNANTSIIFARTKSTPICAVKIKIYQIIINLISNAIESMDGKISKPKNKVIITLQETDKDLVLEVSDNGCGISSDKINKIFDNLYTTKKSGTGIGLANTKKIIEKDLSGKIKLKSQVDVGTTFTVTIPKNKKITN